MDEIEFLEKRVEEEEAMKRSLMKQHEKLESNKENLLTGFNNLMRELRNNRNKTVRCSEQKKLFRKLFDNQNLQNDLFFSKSFKNLIIYGK